MRANPDACSAYGDGADTGAVLDDDRRDRADRGSPESKWSSLRKLEDSGVGGGDGVQEGEGLYLIHLLWSLPQQRPRLLLQTPLPPEDTKSAK